MSDAPEAERKTLLIGFEPTPEGEDALALGALLAEVLDATPLVVRVFRRPPGVVEPAEIEEAMAEEAEATSAVIPERLIALAPRTLAVAHNSIGGALFEVASDENAVAIVIGSGRSGALGRVLPGSTGRALLHGAPSAIAVAPRGYAGMLPDRILHVGAGFDASLEATVALDVAISIASRSHARLSVLTVADYVSYGYASTWSVLGAGEIHDLELEASEKILDEGIARVPADLPVEGRLTRGNAGEQLVLASEDLDLLVVGSRAYGPIRRAMLGSASTRLLNDAHAPVLVLARGVDASVLAKPRSTDERAIGA